MDSHGITDPTKLWSNPWWLYEQNNPHSFKLLPHRFVRVQCDRDKAESYNLSFDSVALYSIVYIKVLFWFELTIAHKSPTID